MKKKREEAKRLKEEGKDVPKSKRQEKQEKQVKEVIQQQGQMFTEEQVSKMVESGIAKYEVQRKARKVVKKKKQEEEEQQKQVQRQVQRALGQPAEDDIWGRALAGLI
jgi:protein-disulfide isomerase-like protein with CxxC motif